MTQLIEELKERMPEKAFHFADFPEVVFFDDLADQIESLEGAEITEFETDGTIETWIEFTYADQHFYINNRLGDYWLFVENPKAPEQVLLEVANHFRKLLERNSSEPDSDEEFSFSEFDDDGFDETDLDEDFDEL